MYQSFIILSVLILFFITPLPQVFAAKQGTVVERHNNTPMLPDLSIKHVRLDRHNKISVRIVNNAKYGVPVRFWSEKGKKACTLSLKINSKNWGGATLQKFDPGKKLAKPGGKVTYVFNRTLTSKTLVDAIIDSFSVVKESNEKNNMLRVILVP